MDSNRKLIYTENATDESNVRHMLLTKHIGPPSNENEARYSDWIDGTRFSEEMNYLKSQGFEINVKINSVGGSVLHGWTIMDAVLTNEASVHNIGLAASMAGMVFCCSKKRKSETYATIMLHPASNAKEKNSPYATVVSETFRKMLKEKSTLSEEQLETIFAGGDHFFPMDKATEAGFVDEWVNSMEKKVEMPLMATAAEYYEVYNNNLIENQKQSKEAMEKPSFIPDFLKGVFGAKDDQETVTNALAQKSENEKLKIEATAKDAEIENLKAALEVETNARMSANVATEATALIEKAEADGKLKLDADQKAEWVKNATAHFELVSSMIEKMSSVRAAAAAIPSTEKSKGLTYIELATKHPDQLRVIAESDPELFARLQDEYNESQKK
jgi:ATP-dependent protease ClpP protease subunit